jgi:hypothetical protein
MPFKYSPWQYSIAAAEGQRQARLSTEFDAMYAEVGRPSFLQGTGRVIQQPHVTVYADIAEVRMEVQAANCNRLLADGWVLLGVYPLTSVGEMVPARGAETAPGHPAVCAALGGLCCGKETRVVSQGGSENTPQTSVDNVTQIAHSHVAFATRLPHGE